MRNNYVLLPMNTFDDQTTMARQARKHSGTDTRSVVWMNLIEQPSYKKMNRIINAYIRCGRITARTCSLATASYVFIQIYLVNIL